MRKYIACLLILLSVVLLSVQADAYIVKQGTITIGASAYNQSRDFDHSNSREQYFNVSAGYFLQDNIEIGAGLSHDHFDSTSQRSTTWTLSPSFRYHKPLNEHSDVYGAAGLFFTSKDTTFRSGGVTTQDSSGVTIGVGWEYFFNANVALDIGLSYSRAEWKLGGSSISSDKENRYYWPQISLRVFL